jgi:hypothetical protein
MNFDDYYAIEKLVTRYAVCADKGDTQGVAELLEQCVLHLPGGQTIDFRHEGVKAYFDWYASMICIYPDSGTPKTRRLMGTIVIDDDGPDRARSQSNVICFQAADDFPLQAIAAGTLHDRFEKRSGRWCLVERREDLELIGDLSRHVLDTFQTT